MQSTRIFCNVVQHIKRADSGCLIGILQQIFLCSCLALVVVKQIRMLQEDEIHKTAVHMELTSLVVYQTEALIARQVYAMTTDEARAVTQAAVHSTVSDCNITAVKGKNSGENVNRAFNHMKLIADSARRWYDQYKDFKTVGNYVDATETYTPKQTITTTQVYNVSKKTWENYNQRRTYREL